jgi:opacity protein-like surface antigen
VRKIIGICLISTIIISVTQAQINDEMTERPDNQIGFVFTMAESGSGLGGFIAWPLFGGFHLGFNLDAYFLRDSKQIDTYYYYTGTPYSINKENNVYLFDAMITLKKRFFADDLDESFRPFLSAGVGPYYGMNFPEYDTTPEGEPNYDQYRFTVGGFVGAGVDISVNEKMFVGVRGQYRIIPFTQDLGERANHSMFELRFEIGRRY